jgi:hypothetical protein
VSNYLSRLFIYVSCDFLGVPSNNIITLDEWKNQLQNELTIIETIDITDKTFIPYYKHFLPIYLKQTKIPEFIFNFIIDYFVNNQPYSYVVAVCKKLN